MQLFRLLESKEVDPADISLSHLLAEGRLFQPAAGNNQGRLNIPGTQERKGVQQKVNAFDIDNPFEYYRLS